MTEMEFKEMFQPFSRFVIKPKPGIEKLSLGGWVLSHIEDKYRAKYEESGDVFVFQKGKSSWGYRATLEQILDQFDIVVTDKNKQWQKRLTRAINAMEHSGLWPNILETFKNLQKMTYQDRVDIYDLTCCRKYYDIVYNNDLSVDEYNEKFEQIFNEYMSKYPFIFSKDDDGRWRYHSDYLYEMSGCQLKSMYFGKYRNKEYKKDIKKAIQDREKISRWARTSYDVTFEYDPEKEKAWYSEEYKDCGNGHYYIALDHNLALFCEND